MLQWFKRCFSSLKTKVTNFIFKKLHYSGSLANVRQIGIEFHEVTGNIKRYFTIVQELYKLGFVTIAWDPNLTTTSFTKGPFRFFEFVFRRSDVAACKV